MSSTASPTDRDRPLCGQRVAFTGKMSVSRRRAQQVVIDAGGEPCTHVSRRTSMVVVGMEGWPLLPDGSISTKLHRAEQLNRDGARIRIISEQQFWEELGHDRPAQPGGQSFSAERVCEVLNISQATLRRWELLSLITARDGQYDYQDIVSLRTIAELVGRGVKPEIISRNLRKLRSVLPNTERPLAQLRIVTEDRDTLVAEFGGARMRSDGQMTLLFDDHTDESHRTLALAADEPDPAEWLDIGLEHEEHERYHEAEDAYRSAIADCPHYPEAYFNLGNVLSAAGRLDAAVEVYRIALNQDPSLTCALYNLADVFEQQGRLGDAIEHLRRALNLDPDFADAHFNLASFLEQAGRGAEAEAHWAAYLRLDPASEWGQIARQRLHHR